MTFQTSWQSHEQAKTWVPAPEKVAALKAVLTEYFTEKR
jgi:hypothetical protein